MMESIIFSIIEINALTWNFKGMSEDNFYMRTSFSPE
jgi:hypothetical protein